MVNPAAAAATIEDMSLEELLSAIGGENDDEASSSAPAPVLGDLDASHDDTCMLDRNDINVGNGGAILHDDPNAFDAGETIAVGQGLPPLGGIGGGFFRCRSPCLGTCLA